MKFNVEKNHVGYLKFKDLRENSHLFQSTDSLLMYLYKKIFNCKNKLGTFSLSEKNLIFHYIFYVHRKLQFFKEIYF